MLLAVVAALGLLQQPEPRTADQPGGRFLPEIGIPEQIEEPGICRRGNLRLMKLRLTGLPVAPPPRPKADIKSAAARGVEAAEADIKAGCPTIRVYGKRSISVRGLGEGDSGMVDADTGLPIKGVAGCMAGDELVAEADAYNEVMRAWVAKKK